MNPVASEAGYFLSIADYSIESLPPNSTAFNNLLIESLKKFDNEIGTHVLYYSTFKKDGYKNNIATLMVTNQPQSNIYIIAPEDQLTGAVLWVKLHNRHLKFAEWSLTDHMEDDFENNRKTAVINLQFNNSIYNLNRPTPKNE